MTRAHVVILGAGAAGTAAARTLSSHDDLRVTLVARTGETPYTRMLVKAVAFGPTPPEFITLALPSVTLITDTAVAVDTSAKKVRLASGEQLTYDALVIATGSTPRELPAAVFAEGQSGDPDQVSVLHSLEDALRIRELLTNLERPARVAIYGGGIIAAEAASTLHTDGHKVMLIARSPVPGVRAFGAPVAKRLAADHATRVRAQFGRTIEQIDGTETGTGIALTLDDGTTVLADLLLVALGTAPNAPAPWVDGVDVDERLRAGHACVYAAGGVATHRDEALGTWRIDHWEDAAAQGTHAALTALHDLGLAVDPGRYLPRSPYVAMVYGQMVAGVGHPAHADAYARLDEGGDVIVRHETSDGVVVAVTGINAVNAVYQWAQGLHGEAPGPDRSRPTHKSPEA